MTHTMQSPRKAVFPVAGLGTRFLPATKANPKEMLPIVDKPLIQYAVEEAIAAGFTDLIFVTSSSKRAIEDHFDKNFELECRLLDTQKHELLSIVQNILPKGVSCAYIRQPETLGLGHAVLCARPLINDEPFAVLLADDLISIASSNCLSNMLTLFNQTQQSILAVEHIKREDSQKYGVIATGTQSLTVVTNPVKITAIVEKPLPQDAPSTFGVVGRYIFTPDIFSCLEKTAQGAGGEIQLTDAIALLLQTQCVNAMTIPSKRYDCGSKLGYLEATIAFGLAHPELNGDFAALLKHYAAQL